MRRLWSLYKCYDKHKNCHISKIFINRFNYKAVKKGTIGAIFCPFLAYSFSRFIPFSFTIGIINYFVKKNSKYF